MVALFRPNEVGIEVSVDKVKHIFMYILQSREKLHIKTPQDDQFLENNENFQLMESNQNSMHEERNTILDSVNACYHSMSNLSPSRFVF